MKTLLIVLALIVVIGVGLGVYLNWFYVSSDNEHGKPNVTVTVNEDKIEADKDKAVQGVHDLEHKVLDKPAAVTQKARD